MDLNNYCLGWGGCNLFKALKCEIVNSKMGNVYAPNKN